MNELESFIMGDASTEQALVNENQSSPQPESVNQPNEILDFIIGSALPQETGSKEEAKERIEAEYRSRLPKSWFGEASHGLSRSVDQLQQTGYAVGSLLSDSAGLEKVANWFNEGIRKQDEEIALAPSRAQSYTDVDGFDKAMSYLSSTAGELLPDIGSAILSGGVGAFLGKKALQEVVEKKAISSVIKNITDNALKKELQDYSVKKITKNQLTDAAKSLLTAEVSQTAGKYGALSAMATNSIGQEVGSIYSELKKDPNLQESDRKIAAITGGLIAGMADFAVEGWLATKFFKTPNVSTAELTEAKSFLKNYVETYGKEWVKAMPSEGGTELFQTIVEEASKNWADPKKRNAIFSFSPEQKESFIDATIKGGLGGSLMAGATAFAEMAPHPDPKVRKEESDILAMANDMSPDALPIIEDDSNKRLSQISNNLIELEQKRNASIAQGLATDSDTIKKIDEEISALSQEQDTILGEEQSLVNETDKQIEELQKIGASRPLQEQKSNEMLQEVQDLRDTVSQKIDRVMGERTEAVDKEAVKAKRKDWGLAGVNPNIQNALDDRTVNFLIKEGVDIRKPTAGEFKKRMQSKDTFGVIDDGKDGISILIPSAEKLKELSPDDVNDLISHEIVHVADLVQIRQEAKEKGITLAEHEGNVMEERGSTLRAALPHIANETVRVYFKNKDTAKMTDRQLGQEFVRMAVESLRKGKFEEVTDAIASAQDMAQDPTAGRVAKNMLKQWMDVIKSLYKNIAQMFDSKTAPEPIVRAVDQINKVLDKYGVLVNENQPKTTIKAPPSQEGQRGTTSTADVFEKVQKKSKPANPETVSPQELARAEGVRYDGLTSLGEAEADQFHNFSDTTSIPGTTVSFTVEGTPTPENVKAKHEERLAAFKANPPKQPEPLVNEKKEEPKPEKKTPVRKRHMRRTDKAIRTTVDRYLTEDEKQDAAELVGEDFWNEQAKSKFIDSFKNWLEGTKRVKGRLLELFKSVLDAIPRSIIAALISVGAINDNAQARQISPMVTEVAAQVANGESVVDDPERSPAFANLETDEEKRTIATREGFKYDGNMMGRLDLYTDYKDQGTNPAYGATIGIKTPYTEEDLMDKFEETRQKFSTPLVNENPAAQANIRNTGSNAAKKALKEAVANANRLSNNAITNIDIKEAERRQVQGEVDYDGATPLDLQYTTRTHTGSMFNAQILINEQGDALHVAQSLERDMLGKELGLGEFGADSPLAAIYENVIRQLVNIARQMYNKGHAGSYAYNEIKRLKDVLEENYRRMNNAGGSMSAFTGMSTVIMDAESARKEAMETIMPHAEKIVGKEAKQKFTSLVQELNNLWGKYATNVANSPKVIAALRKLHALVNERKWVKGAKATMARDLKKLEGLVNRAAARASEYMAGKKDSEAMINKVANRIVKDMAQDKKEADTPDEWKVLHSALGTIGLEVQDRNKGPFIPTESSKIKLRDKFAALLQNQGLYNEFITKLRNEYIKAYGGQFPSDEFMAKVDTIFSPMRGMPWTQEMTKTLVNETLRDFEVKLAKVVKQSFSEDALNKYDETSTIADQVRNGIIQFLHDQGVEDQALVDALASDIDTEINESIDTARNEFFTGRGTIREFLKSMGTNLSEAAKSHATYIEGMENKFLDFLVKKGYPNTRELPVASTLAKAMQDTFNEMVYAERVKIVKKWQQTALKKGANDLAKGKMDKVIERILQMANIGAIRQEDIYRALQSKFDLPEYSEATARKISELGDLIGNASANRTKDILKQQLADYINNRKGLKTSDIYTSWMYFSMLSGPSTWMVNIAGNAASLLGYLAVEAVRHPQNLPRMLRSLTRTMTGVASLEAKEAFWTGQALGKQGEKYFSRTNPIEQEDVYLKESMFSGGRLEALDKAAAGLVHKASRGLKGQFVGRFLAATDIFFYKIAEEMAYTARVGEIAITPQMWESAMAQARGDLLIQGKDPDTNPEYRRQQQIIAHSLLNDINFEKSRFRDSSGALVNERVTAWTESRSEALDATFTQEPRGILGFVARSMEALTSSVPILKLLIPFTRVAANVTNQMLDWTPYGFGRWAFGHVYGDDFRVPKKGGIDTIESFNKLDDDMKKRDSGIAIRAAMGTLAIFALIMSADDEDDRDPYFTIYGDGPKDIELRRQMQQRGWKPNTIKVGRGYYSYLYTPLAMALSIVGKQFDNARQEKVEPSIINTFSPSSAVALLDAVKNQSFLAGITDLFSALDSPDPETRVSRIMGRIATIPVPNFAKQIDRVLDPSVQQAQGFYETIIREIPIARHLNKPALNIFGKPVERTYGLVRFPGLERFMTMEKTDDPVLNLLSEKQLKVPGISKSTNLGDERMTVDQYYEYVQIVGDSVYKRYLSELNSIRQMDREIAQERLEQISSEEKKKAREKLKEKYGISR